MVASAPRHVGFLTLPDSELAVSTHRPTNLPAYGPCAIETRDHEAIRRWAARHHAEPATGEATATGPATVQLRDGGAGIRFNFPAVGRFRPISWDEWFEHFERHDLVFVYEEEVADRAFALWLDRGGTHGHDRADWFEAERQLAGSWGRPMGRYRLAKRE